MKILNWLKQTSDPKSRAVCDDLNRLNDVRPGLANNAIDYVLEGCDSTVLATLSNSCTGTELEVCQGWLRQTSPSQGRRKLPAHHEPFDLRFSKRYTEVLAATCPSLPESAVGSDETPKLVRVFFSEAFGGIDYRSNRWPSNPAKSAPKGLELNAVVDITRELGGDIVDLIDVIYTRRGRYASDSGKLYQSTVNVRPLVEANPQAFIAAGRRMNATSIRISTAV